MAIFSYSVGRNVSRGAGQSAVKVAAYQARENYTDERTGYAYNHYPREGITAASTYIGREAGYDEGRKPALFVGLYAPKDAPEWCRGAENVETFWNRLEVFERRLDAQIAERHIIALPHELTLQQNIWALQDYVRDAFTRQGRVVQVAIHAPEHGDGRNIHAHLLISIRGVNENGFNPSKQDSQERFLHRREYVQGLRERWTETANRHLERHGHEARIDHRTLAEQGIDRAPTIHLGPGDSRRERHGERSVAGEVNREVAARNAERATGPRPRGEGLEREHEPPRSRAPAAAAREAVETREAERAPAAPEAENPAPGAPERGRERQKVGVLERGGRMLRSAFERTLDWIAPRVEEPRLQPPPTLEPEKPAPERPLPLYERIALRAQEREREEGRGQAPGFRREDSPLYERYKAEREAALHARQAAEREVHERFAAYTQDLRGFYQMRFEQEKHSGMPSPMRHDAMELLAAQRRGDRGHTIRLEREQLGEVRRAHPLPSWEEFLKREASKGDRDAARALERHEAREAERNRDRDDDGRGIEP